MNRLFLLALLAALALSLGLLVACSSGDDDDDNNDSADDDAADDDAADDDAADDDTAVDDDSGDDDSGGASGAYDECVSYMVDCVGLDQATAEQSCSYIDAYGSYWNDCFDSAFGDYWGCLESAGCGEDYDTDAAMACYNDLLAAVSACY